MDVRLSRERRHIDVTMIGVGAMIGAGILVLAGIGGGGDRCVTERVGPLHG